MIDAVLIQAEMKKKRKHWLAGLAMAGTLLLACVGAMAKDFVLNVDHADTNPIPLAPYFSVLEDAGQKLTLADVQKTEVANQFAIPHAEMKGVNFGFTRSAHWLRLTLRNDSATAVERMIEISFPPISDIQFFHPLEGGAYRTVRTGAAHPFATRPHPSRFFVFPVTLPASASQIFYFRVQSTSSIVIPATLWEPQAFYLQERTGYAIQAGYFGMALALTLFNLLLFFSMRDWVYLLYSIATAMMALVVSVANGFSAEFLWPQSPFWSNISLNVLYSCAFAAQLIFIQRLLDLKTISPQINRFFSVLIGVLVLLPIGFFVSIEAFAEPALIAWAMAGFAVLMSLLYCAYFKRHRLSALVALAYGMLLLGGLMVVLNSFSWVPHNIFTEQGLQRGSALEMLLLAFALAYRFNLIRKQATQVVKNANIDLAKHLQAREAELTAIHLKLRESEHLQTLSQERQRLMQDMHDGIGSSLTSALRMVERGHLQEAALASVLTGCIDDLKLAIDSMEPVDADLLLLLATLRFRLGPRLEAIGIRLVWEVEQVPALEWLEPKLSLHILRILQEAFTNIIKHANATEIRVATGMQGHHVAVSICDNGSGFTVVDPTKENNGKGLANQRRRAQAIGAWVRWESTNAGTCLTLHLPVERSED